VKIVSGEYEVFDSGNLYVYGIQETKFIISEKPKMEIVFRPVFDDSGERKITLEAINDYTLAFIFSNPSGLGYGNGSPVKVGHLNGKELYANFHINIKGNDEAYDLRYTFLLKEVKDA